MCLIDGCERSVVARDYCDPHYRRLMKYGDPTAGRPLYARHPTGRCSIAGCERAHCARGYCDVHYRRWKKHGDALVVQRAATGSLVGVMCDVDGCDEPARVKRMCLMHYTRWRKHGDPATVLSAGRKPIATPTYSGMHSRLTMLRTGHCSTPDCDGTPTEMALIHGRAIATSEQGRPYSNRIEDYRELCARCHRRYDFAAKPFRSFSAEHREKLSAARRAWWAQKREQAP